MADVWAQGGAGALQLAEEIVSLCENEADFKPLYQVEDSIDEKITKIVTEIYGGSDVEYSLKAKKQMAQFVELGWDKLPICMAKTQYSLSDNAKALGAPKDFTIHIREFVPKLGAGFLVALTGNVLTMPGLPKKPAADGMDIDAEGKLSGIY